MVDATESRCSCASPDHLCDYMQLVIPKPLDPQILQEVNEVSSSQGLLETQVSWKNHCKLTQGLALPSEHQEDLMFGV